MSLRRVERTLCVALFMVVCAGAVAWVSAQSDVAKRYGMTDDELKRFVEKTLGELVLVDKQRDLAVAIRRADGKIESVQIVDGKKGVTLRLDYRTGDEPPQVTCTSSTLGAQPRIVKWIDLNGDGIFDQRFVFGDCPQLETGHRLLLDGKWMEFRPTWVHHAGMTPFEDAPPDAIPQGTMNDKPYRFDLKSGKWEPGPAAAPSTQPAR